MTSIKIIAVKIE